MAINAYQPVAGSTVVNPQERPGAHTLNVIGAVTPLKMVPDIMNRAAFSAVKGSSDAGLALRAGANGLQGLKPTFGAALWQTLNPMNIFRSLKFGALISFPLALIQNFLDMKDGKINQQQMLAGTVADGVGYTVAGTVGTMIGGLVGSIVPFGGTLIGMLVGGGVGILLGEFYDKMFKPISARPLKPRCSARPPAAWAPPLARRLRSRSTASPPRPWRPATLRHRHTPSPRTGRSNSSRGPG